MKVEQSRTGPLKLEQRRTRKNKEEHGGTGGTRWNKEEHGRAM